MEKTYEILKTLSLLPGVPGQEKKVRAYIKSSLDGYADQFVVDNLGSLIAIKKQEGPKVMIAGHMDEVGLLVTQITKDGFIKFQTLGGWFSQVMLAQVWDIHTPKGVITAVTGVKPPHIIPVDKRKESAKSGSGEQRRPLDKAGSKNFPQKQQDRGDGIVRQVIDGKKR